LFESQAKKIFQVAQLPNHCPTHPTRVIKFFYNFFFSVYSQELADTGIRARIPNLEFDRKMASKPVSESGKKVFVSKPVYIQTGIPIRKFVFGIQTGVQI
jgi:hypothetical protein